MDSAVQVRELTKRFDAFTAVDHVSFEIQPGEIVGLLGPNGAGKTTTIQMLLGVTTPTSGEIRILGMDLRRDRERILEQVNFSSTYVSLPYSLTIWENLSVFAKLYRVPNPAARIDYLCSVFEIADIKHKLTRKLSSGQMTRLSLAKALLNDPKSRSGRGRQGPHLAQADPARQRPVDPVHVPQHARDGADVQSHPVS
jgi:ABC-2 type transport system ATP-binding protein